MKVPLCVAALLPYCIFSFTLGNEFNGDDIPTKILDDVYDFKFIHASDLEEQTIQFDYSSDDKVQLTVQDCKDPKFNSSKTENDISEIHLLFYSDQYHTMVNSGYKLGLKVECRGAKNIHWMNLVIPNSNTTSDYIRITMDVGRCKKHKRHIKRIGVLVLTEKKSLTFLYGGMLTVSPPNPCKVMNSFKTLYTIIPWL